MGTTYEGISGRMPPSEFGGGKEVSSFSFLTAEGLDSRLVAYRNELMQSKTKSDSEKEDLLKAKAQELILTDPEVVLLWDSLQILKGLLTNGNLKNREEIEGISSKIIAQYVSKGDIVGGKTVFIDYLKPQIDNLKKQRAEFDNVISTFPVKKIGDDGEFFDFPEAKIVVPDSDGDMEGITIEVDGQNYLVEKMFTGGMQGYVCKAKDTSTGRQVVLKVFVGVKHEDLSDFDIHNEAYILHRRCEAQKRLGISAEHGVVPRELSHGVTREGNIVVAKEYASGVMRGGNATNEIISYMLATNRGNPKFEKDWHYYEENKENVLGVMKATVLLQLKDFVDMVSIMEESNTPGLDMMKGDDYFVDMSEGVQVDPASVEEHRRGIFVDHGLSFFDTDYDDKKKWHYLVAYFLKEGAGLHFDGIKRSIKNKLDFWGDDISTVNDFLDPLERLDKFLAGAVEDRGIKDDFAEELNDIFSDLNVVAKSLGLKMRLVYPYGAEPLEGTKKHKLKPVSMPESRPKLEQPTQKSEPAPKAILVDAPKYSPRQGLSSNPGVSVSVDKKSIPEPKEPVIDVKYSPSEMGVGKVEEKRRGFFSRLFGKRR
ncbi:MAG: hypothetical protein WC070_02485 [Candidatus Magasanikbacteria bacterium]